jgi:hypothetical protein
VPASSGGALCGPAFLNWGEPVWEDKTNTNYCVTPGTPPFIDHQKGANDWFIPRFGNVAFLKGSGTVAGRLVLAQFDLQQDNGQGAMESVHGSFSSAGGEELDQPDLIDVVNDQGGPMIADVGVMSPKRGLAVKHLIDKVDGDNMAPRQPIQLKGLPDDPDVTIILDEPKVAIDPTTPGAAPPMVKIYKGRSDTTPLSFNGRNNVFGKDSRIQDQVKLPVTLWVEGVSGSDHMDDLEITAEIKGTNGCKTDMTTFTVLDVDQPTVQSDLMSDDDSAYAKYWSHFPRINWGPSWQTITDPDKLGMFETQDVGPNNTLGLRDYVLGPPYLVDYRVGGPYLIGYGVEGKAIVHPSNFSPSRFGVHLQLARDADFNAWGLNPAGQTILDQLSLIRYKRFDSNAGQNPPWNDSDPGADRLSRDDDPAGSGGALYDVDVPGFPIQPKEYSPYHARTHWRGNFRLYGAVQLTDGTWVRCSPKARYWIGTAWIQIDSTIRLPGPAKVVGGRHWVPDNDSPADNTMAPKTDTGPEGWNLQ